MNLNRLLAFLNGLTLPLPLLGLILGLGANLNPLSAWSECRSQVFQAILATPFSSRISRAGDKLEAVLQSDISSGQSWDEQTGAAQGWPSGTQLRGSVQKVASSRDVADPGVLARFVLPGVGPSVFAIPDTPDGWLCLRDTETDVWERMPTRSTVLLTQQIQRRLGTDRAVWNQILGINASTLQEDFGEDFMRDYHRRDVLVGAGDRLRLRIVCPKGE